MGAFGGPRYNNRWVSVMQLDAGSIRSYSGSGTTWYDISGNGNDHGIVNGPTFANGAFTMNETQGFNLGSMPTTSTTSTIVIFYKTTDTQELWVRGNAGNFYVAASNNNDGSDDYVASPTYYVDTLSYN